jgi:hypothetical protein
MTIYYMDIVKRRRLFLINHKSPFIPVKVHNVLKGFYVKTMYESFLYKV